jgi:hypothetical protein
MCLLGIAFRQFEEVPLLVLANREEFYARPTAGPRVFPRDGETPAWFGGIDLVAGGTWLGVNEFGLLVAVTNRQKQSHRENPPSRGLLCRSLLRFRDTTRAVAAAESAVRDNKYAGCNLLIADRDSAVVVEAGDIFISTRLDPGFHLLANAALNDDDDPRILRVRREFEQVRGLGVAEWFAEARRVCPLRAEGTEPAICLAGHDRGTVSSTILGVARDPVVSRYWYALGPPDVTPYEEYTTLFGEMLAGGADQGVTDIEPPEDSPARTAVRQSLNYRTKARDSEAGSGDYSSYRILLRGPWACEPLARAERDAIGALVWTSGPLPAAGTVRLPASWQDLFGDFRGRVRFRRRFHPPSNIEAGDRLAIVFDGAGGTGSVALNGHGLGQLDSATGAKSFEATGLLQVNNELAVELEFTETGKACPPGGLFGPVALEIWNTGK